MPENITFLLDAPTTGTSRVQIAKTGKFRDSRYGKFSITADDFTSWVRNFSQFHGQGAGLPIDIDHSPEKRGTTEAAGWVKSLDTKGPDGKTDTPDQLWAVVEWNSLGKSMIEDRRYLYISPSYHHNFADENGTKHGTALVGIAMTNRPFLSMATVSLSTQDVLAIEETLAPAVGRAWVTTASNSSANTFIEGTTPLTAEASDTPSQMPELTQIAEALTLSTDASEDQIVAAIRDLASKVPGEGQVVLAADRVESLVTQAAAGEKALARIDEMTFNAAYDKAMSEGKVGAAQRDTFKALYDADADNALKALDSLEKAVPTAPQGGSGEPATNGSVRAALGPVANEFSLDEGRADLLTRAEALASEKGIDILDAAIMIEEGQVA